MNKKIKLLFCALSVASVLLPGCAGIPIALDYSCYATNDSSVVGDISDGENQDEITIDDKWNQLIPQKPTEDETQPSSGQSTDTTESAESAETDTTELAESAEPEETTKKITDESKKDSDSEKKGFSETLRDTIMSILLFLGGLVCGVIIASVLNFVSNEKSEKKQLENLKDLSREIENIKIRINELNAASNELKELSDRVDNVLKKF